jgi:hypothetical protein
MPPAHPPATDSPATAAPWSARVVARLSGGGLTALVFVGGLALLRLRRDEFSFWEDEGINLVKAQLSSLGHPLYREIYSDQGPLFTWILAVLHRALAGDYQLVRGVALVFGAAVLTAGFALARRIAGPMAGLSCAIVLGLFAPLQKFGSALVTPVPALAFGAWAIWWALRARQRQLAAEAAVSGALLALSVCIKFAFLYLVPVAVLGLLLPRRPVLGDPSSRRRLAAWALGFAAPVLLVSGAVPDLRAMLAQTVAPHLAAESVFGAQARDARHFLLLAPGFVLIYFAAAAGLAALIAWRSSQGAVLATWIGIVLTWMLLHRPIWAHFLPELLLPLAVCLSSGAVLLLQRAQAVGRDRLPALAAALVVLASSAVGLRQHVGSYDAWRLYHDNTTFAGLTATAQALRRVTSSSDWILVDRPILAYLAGRQVPPEVAVVSEKRLRVGSLSDGQMAHTMDLFKPAAVALCSRRFDRFDEVNRRLRARYVLTSQSYQTSDHQLYPASCRIYRLRQTGVTFAGFGLVPPASGR